MNRLVTFAAAILIVAGAAASRTPYRAEAPTPGGDTVQRLDPVKADSIERRRLNEAF